MMTENAKSMRYAARWNTERISMTPLSQLDALRQNSLTGPSPSLEVITHTFGQFGSFLCPTSDMSWHLALKKPSDNNEQGPEHDASSVRARAHLGVMPSRRKPPGISGTNSEHLETTRNTFYPALDTATQPNRPPNLSPSARSSLHRAEWTKTRPNIASKWSVRHVWPTNVPNGPEAESEACSSPIHHFS